MAMVKRTSFENDDCPIARSLDAIGDWKLVRFTMAIDRKSTRLNSSHRCISYAVFCLKKKNYQFDLDPSILHKGIQGGAHTICSVCHETTETDFDIQQLKETHNCTKGVSHNCSWMSEV